MKRLSRQDAKNIYETIYDEVCNYLDSEFAKNICDFQNNKCGEKRNAISCVGCCRHWKNKRLGPALIWNKLVVCEYLKDKKCTVKCISCKLFTCDYLHQKGYQFKIKDIALLKEFNVIQKYIIKTNTFTPKEKIIKKLLFWRSDYIYFG